MRLTEEKRANKLNTYDVTFRVVTDDDPSALLDAVIELSAQLSDLLEDALVDENKVRVALTEGDDDTERKVAIGSTVTPEFLWGVFVTALEGGIGYWSQCLTYKQSLEGGGPLDADHDGFHAVIRDYEGEKRTINSDVIHKGIQLLLTGEAKINGDLLGSLVAGVVKNDGGFVDAEVADCVVQAGLFEQIVYG